MWNYPYFSVREMQCKCGCGGLPKDSFMEILVAVREELNIPLVVSSGFRCADYNALVANSGRDGPHVMGLAADIRIYGDNALHLLLVGVKNGMRGIGLSQKGFIPSRYVHLDSVIGDAKHPRPWIWSY